MKKATAEKTVKPLKMSKSLKTAIRITLLVLAALIVGLNVYSFNVSRLAGDPVPMPFGVGSAVVLSGSMEPAISVGDLLIISRQDAYQVGDIVVYQSGRIAVTHRIVSISEDEVITRGDANNAEDDPIPPEHITGEVVLIIPCVGYLVNIIKTPLVTLAIIALAVFLMERSFRAEKEKDKQRLEDIKAEIEKLKRDQFPKS